MKVKSHNDLTHKLPSSPLEDDYPYALSAEVFNTKDLFLYSEKVRPGTKASAPHYHSSTDEIAFLLDGELIAVEGSKEVILNKGDFICFEANSKKLHWLENRSEEEATFLIFRKSTVNNDIIS